MDLRMNPSWAVLGKRALALTVVLSLLVASICASMAQAAVQQDNASTGTRSCLSELYDSYRVVNAHMQHAGKGNQDIAFQAEVGSVDCPGITRVLSGALQLKKKSWINMDGPLHGPHPLWLPMYRGNQPGVAQIDDLNSNHLKVRTWQPGNKARLEMRFQARDKRSGKIVGTHIRFFPIGISRGAYHWKVPNFHPEF